MGPQLDSCGRLTIAHKTLAAPELQWGRNLTVAEGCSGEVSNFRLYELQWGRNLTVAEGTGFA